MEGYCLDTGLLNSSGRKGASVSYLYDEFIKIDDFSIKVL